VARFDKLGNGMSVPVVEGAVVFESDRDKIIQESKIMAMKSEENLRKRVEKEAKKAWKSLIRGILIKKYMIETYKNE